jgi:MFS family permease
VNPYTPPEAKLKDPGRQPGSPVKAVVFGLLADVGGTFLGSMVFGIVYGAMLASGGVSPAESQAALANVGRTGWGFAILSVMGCGFSVLGGYVCARVSRRLDFRLGLTLAALSAGSGLVMGQGSEAPVQNLLMAGVTVACVLMGTWYGIRQNQA